MLKAKGPAHATSAAAASSGGKPLPVAHVDNACEAHVAVVCCVRLGGLKYLQLKQEQKPLNALCLQHARAPHKE